MLTPSRAVEWKKAGQALKHNLQLSWLWIGDGAYMRRIRAMNMKDRFCTCVCTDGWTKAKDWAGPDGALVQGREQMALET